MWHHYNHFSIKHISTHNSVFKLESSTFIVCLYFNLYTKEMFVVPSFCLLESFPFLSKEGEASTPWTLITMSVVCCSGFRSCTFRRISSSFICLPLSLNLINWKSFNFFKKTAHKLNLAKLALMEHITQKYSSTIVDAIWDGVDLIQ